MDEQHDPVGTRTRPADPYWRPGDPDVAPPARPERTGGAAVVLLMLLGALAAVGLVVVLVIGVPAVLTSSGVSPQAETPSQAAIPPPGGTAEPVGVGDAPADVEVGHGAVWTADRGSGSVTRVDAATGATTSARVGGEPTALVVGRDLVWVWNYSSALAPVAIDGEEAEPLVYLPRDTSSIALSGDTLWYTQPDTGTVGRLDARTGAPLPELAVGGRPDQIAADGNRLTVLDAGGTVRTVDGATGRALDAAAPAPSGTTTVVAAEGRRYAIGEAGVSELGPVPPAPLRYPTLTGLAAGSDGVWLLDAGGVLRHLSPDLRPLGETAGLGAGGDVTVGPDGTVWVLDTAAGTVRAVRPG